MRSGHFNVVTDGAWGSCGKGLISSFLAFTHRPQVITTTNMANAGHVAVNVDGTSFTGKALPAPAILGKWYNTYKPTVCIGPTAAFHEAQMHNEIEQCGLVGNILIHERAGVITTEHRQTEAGSSSTTKHIASTMQGCGPFLADKVLRKRELKLAGQYESLAPFIFNSSVFGHEYAKLSMLETLDKLLTNKITILHEGSQGFSLDISHGSHYPACTSRGTTANQNIADMGINLKHVGDIYLVIRPFPIRVGNVVEDGVQVGYSGDCYPDQEEVSWSDVAKHAGMPEDKAKSLTTKELTTVTKRLRRVFSFSFTQLRQAVIANSATKIALNFANYIDDRVSNVNNPSDLTQKVKDFIVKVEDCAQIPVTLVGTGPQLNHVCRLD